MKYKTIKNFKNKLQNSDNNEFVDLLFDFIKEEGKTNYDESVTQLQHSLQTASLARTEDGRRHIVIASLLHDIGHLLIDENDSKNDFLKKDLNHENIASNFLILSSLKIDSLSNIFLYLFLFVKLTRL